MNANITGVGDRAAVPLWPARGGGGGCTRPEVGHAREKKGNGLPQIQRGGPLKL
jgi:hypothetical protein